MTIGLRLRALREEMGLRQGEVARGINCSSVTYSRYENGTREPSMGMIVKLAEFYSVSTDYLLGRELMTTDGLSEFEKELVNASRETSRSVRENALEFMQMKKVERHE